MVKATHRNESTNNNQTKITQFNPRRTLNFSSLGKAREGRGRGEETVRGREREISRALPRKGRFARASGGETRKGQGAHGDKTGPRRCGAWESRGAEPRAVTGGPREMAPDEKQMRNILGGCGLTASYDSIPGLMLRWLHVYQNLPLYLLDDFPLSSFLSPSTEYTISIPPR